MARKGRIEFGGAVYHVLDRGDRREPIVRSDGDRAAFVRTLGEACARAGWRLHGFVLLSNHYHLLLETPQANLVAGMRTSYSSCRAFQPAAVSWLSMYWAAARSCG